MRESDSELVLIVAPFGRDAAVAAALLARVRVDSRVCPNLQEACAWLPNGAGMLLLTIEALVPEGLTTLVNTLAHQPPWSALPVIVCASGAEVISSTKLGQLVRLNVSVVERPIRALAFHTTIQMALNARRRQYEVRTLLDQKERAAQERAELLQREQAARQQAESASRAKDDFLAMLGHELRNPLSPIMMVMHLLRLRGDQRFARELTIIERQVTHLSRLVDDLLDVSRIARGKIELRLERVELGEVVSRAIEIAAPLIERQQQELAIEMPSRGLAVQGDRARLAQVLSNLLTNAAKYTPARGQIWVRGTREADQAVVRVRDTGIGITPAMLPLVFDLFMQERQDRDRPQGGLGLGLAIVRNLVALHGGTCTATSDGLDKGSEFTIRLPLLPDKPPEEPRAEPAGGEPLQPPLLSHKILVVDDNEDAASALAQALSLLGYDVQVAYDGPHALQLADGFQPELALLDIGLPVMDGYELGAQLRRRPGLGQICLVALTGYGQEKDVQRSQAAGFNEHLVKPVDLAHLQSVLGRLL